jgi:hypothetical protein
MSGEQGQLPGIGVRQSLAQAFGSPPRLGGWCAARLLAAAIRWPGRVRRENQASHISETLGNAPGVTSGDGLGPAAARAISQRSVRAG